MVIALDKYSVNHKFFLSNFLAIKRAFSGDFGKM